MKHKLVYLPLVMTQFPLGYVILSKSVVALLLCEETPLCDVLPANT